MQHTVENGEDRLCLSAAERRTLRIRRTNLVLTSAVDQCLRYKGRRLQHFHHPSYLIQQSIFELQSVRIEQK